MTADPKAVRAAQLMASPWIWLPGSVRQQPIESHNTNPAEGGEG